MIRKFFRYLFLERPAHKVGLRNYPAHLEAKGATLLAKAQDGADTADNRRQLNHIIGIERWGQSRLRVALGDALTMDEYNSYRPSRDRAWAELQADFEATRQETVTLAKQLNEASVATDVTVPHNQHGELTVLSWLHYLDMHANIEGRRIRS